MKVLTLGAFGARMVKIFPTLIREILRYENNYLTRGVITPPQLWALTHLDAKGACQMNELAVSMNLGFSSATGLVDRMARQGLVKRTRSSQDRRAVRVAITLKGRRIVKQIYAQKRKGVEKLFSRLSARERAKYLEIIEKLVNKLAEKKQ